MWQSLVYIIALCDRQDTYSSYPQQNHNSPYRLCLSEVPVCLLGWRWTTYIIYYFRQVTVKVREKSGELFMIFSDWNKAPLNASFVANSVENWDFKKTFKILVIQMINWYVSYLKKWDSTCFFFLNWEQLVCFIITKDVRPSLLLWQK